MTRCGCLKFANLQPFQVCLGQSKAVLGFWDAFLSNLGNKYTAAGAPQHLHKKSLERMVLNIWAWQQCVQHLMPLNVKKNFRSRQKNDQTVEFEGGWMRLMGCCVRFQVFILFKDQSNMVNFTISSISLMSGLCSAHLRPYQQNYSKRWVQPFIKSPANHSYRPKFTILAFKNS
jgi:hypothetical protein